MSGPRSTTQNWSLGVEDRDAHVKMKGYYADEMKGVEFRKKRLVDCGNQRLKTTGRTIVEMLGVNHIYKYEIKVYLYVKSKNYEQYKWIDKCLGKKQGIKSRIGGCRPKEYVTLIFQPVFEGFKNHIESQVIGDPRFDQISNKRYLGFLFFSSCVLSMMTLQVTIGKKTAGARLAIPMTSYSEKLIYMNSNLPKSLTLVDFIAQLLEDMINPVSNTNHNNNDDLGINDLKNNLENESDRNEKRQILVDYLMTVRVKLMSELGREFWQKRNDITPLKVSSSLVQVRLNQNENEKTQNSKFSPNTNQIIPTSPLMNNLIPPPPIFTFQTPQYDPDSGNTRNNIDLTHGIPSNMYQNNIFNAYDFNQNISYQPTNYGSTNTTPMNIDNNSNNNDSNVDLFEENTTPLETNMKIDDPDTRNNLITNYSDGNNNNNNNNNDGYDYQYNANTVITTTSNSNNNNGVRYQYNSVSNYNNTNNKNVNNNNINNYSTNTNYQSVETSNFSYEPNDHRISLPDDNLFVYESDNAHSSISNPFLSGDDFDMNSPR